MSIIKLILCVLIQKKTKKTRRCVYVCLYAAHPHTLPTCLWFTRCIQPAAMLDTCSSSSIQKHSQFNEEHSFTAFCFPGPYMKSLETRKESKKVCTSKLPAANLLYSLITSFFGFNLVKCEPDKAIGKLKTENIDSFWLPIFVITLLIILFSFCSFKKEKKKQPIHLKAHSWGLFISVPSEAEGN